MQIPLVESRLALSYSSWFSDLGFAFFVRWLRSAHFLIFGGMTMKKTFWLALILLLICVIAFSGCDNNGDTSPDTGDSNQTTESGGNDNSSAVCVHSYGEWATIKQATCKEEGKQVRSCSKCSETEESTVPKSNIHTEVVDAAVPATCTTDGKTEGKHCSVCNKTLVAQTVIKTLGHTEVIDPAVNATCKTEGKTEGKHCSAQRFGNLYEHTSPPRVRI